MKELTEKLISLSRLHWSSLMIISSGILCGIVFNVICGNSFIDSQGLLGGIISSVLVIWLN